MTDFFGIPVPVVLGQLLLGLVNGSFYALLSLGLAVIFGLLGVVNFAHGALFMLGGFCAVGVQKLLNLSTQVKDESIPHLEMMVDVPYLQVWFGDTGAQIISFAVPISVIVAIPLMLLVGVVMERGLIRHFYHRTHADQILVTFGLAIEALKRGDKVARAGWNGKGMWLILVPGRLNVKVQEGTPYGNVLSPSTAIEILPHIDMWTTNSQGRRAMLPGWLASQTDMLSEDWEIVE